jgi:hypothetical protein
VNPTDGVLSEAWGYYKAQWRHLIPIALVVYIVLALATLVLALALTWLGVVLGLVISIVGAFWVQGALTQAVDDIRDGRADMTIGDTFTRVQPRLGAIIVAGLLAGLGIALGLVLFIVPGLILLTWWAVLIPVVVLEERSAGESFSRSRELVRGFGWNVFGVIVLTFLVLIGVSIVLSIVLSPLADWLQGFISNVVSGTLTTPFVALVWTLLYFRLKAAKEEAPAAAPAAPASVAPAAPDAPEAPPQQPPPSAPQPPDAT